MTRTRGLAAQVIIAALVFALVRPPVQAAPLALLPATVASAAGPRVAVVAVGLDPRARTQLGLLEHLGEEALERSGRFEVVSLTDALQPDGYGKRLKSADEAEQKVAEARKALDDLDNVKGLELLVEALALFQHTDLSRRFPDYMSTWVLKAAAHATGGENKEAAAEIEKIIVVFPEAEFLSTFFPPDLIKFADDKRKAANAAAGELTVSTVPSGARVWVDGTFRGTAPVTVQGLAPGKHIATARLAGFAFAQEELGLGDQSIALTEAEQGNTLLRAVNLMAKDPYGSTRDTAAIGLGRQLGVDQVLVFVAKKSTAGEKVELTGLRIEVKDGHNAGYGSATLPMNDPQALATFIDALLQKDAARKGGPVKHFAGSAGGTRKVAGFALLGAGALLLGTGIFFGVQAQGKADQFRRTPQTFTQINNNNASQGRAFSIVADVTYLLGLGAAVGGGVLAFTTVGEKGGAEPSRRRTSSRAPPPRDDGTKAREEADRRARDDADRAAKAEADRAAREEADRRARDDADRAAREADERKAKEEAERKAREDADSGKKLSRKELAEKKKREAEEKKKAEEAKKKEAAEKKKREAEEKKKQEEERRKREEEDRRRREEEDRRRREEDHDDLRNY